MKYRVVLWAIGAAVVAFVLAPVIIWSGQGNGQNPPAASPDASVFKGPAVFTVGPDMTPQELAAREREKMLSILDGRAWFWEHESVAVPLPLVVHEPTRPTDVEYTGLTDLEREKLDMINRGEFQTDTENSGAKKERQTVFKFNEPLRAPGPEGLTPSERAKLEAFRARQKETGGEEGGRSK